MPHLAMEFNRYLEEIPLHKLSLLGDRVLCRVLKQSSRKGLLYVDHWVYAVKTQIGRVLLLGQQYSGDLQLGDYVIFGQWSGREFQSPDETLVLLEPIDIEAKICDFGTSAG